MDMVCLIIAALLLLLQLVDLIQMKDEEREISKKEVDVLKEIEYPTIGQYLESFEGRSKVPTSSLSGPYRPT